MTREDRKYSRLQQRLVKELRTKGITHDRTLEAIGVVPRHRFVEPAFKQRAYEDEALPIGMQQTISQPFTVAFQTMMIDPQKSECILEIGTGSGYQAAILSSMGARVFSIERHETLYKRAKKILSELRYRVTTKLGDGTLGWPAFAPYDKILVTAGATGVPEAILEQLRIPEDHRPGGALVIPIGDESGQVMKKIVRTGPESFRHEQSKTFRFVPLIGEGKLVK